MRPVSPRFPPQQRPLSDYTPLSGQVQPQDFNGTAPITNACPRQSWCSHKNGELQVASWKYLPKQPAVEAEYKENPPEGGLLLCPRANRWGPHGAGGGVRAALGGSGEGAEAAWPARGGAVWCPLNVIIARIRAKDGNAHSLKCV